MKRMIDDKIINKLSIENDVLEIDGTVNADKVTGDEIVENMEGYSCVLGNDDGFTYESIYFGIVKNGNKLTLVCALNLTKTTGSGTPTLATFTVPNSIADKLYPSISIYLDVKEIQCHTDRNNFVNAICSTAKTVDKKLRIDLSAANLVADTKYYVRYEATFLLSDNLIS